MRVALIDRSDQATRCLPAPDHADEAAADRDAPMSRVGLFADCRPLSRLPHDPEPRRAAGAFLLCAVGHWGPPALLPLRERRVVGLFWCCLKRSICSTYSR